MHNTPNIKRLLSAVFLILLSTAGFLHAWFALTQTPFATGWDAYYYLVQIKAVFEEGRMHSPDYSLFYGLLWLVKYCVADYITAFKIAAALIAALYVASLYVTGWRFATKHQQWVAVLCALAGLFSPSAVFMDVTLTKGFLGAVLLIFFIASLPKGKWWVIVPLFVLALMAHRLSGAIAGIFLVAHYLNRRTWWIVGGFLVAALLLLAMLPGSLHLADAARFNREFQWTFQFAPISMVQFYGIEKMHPLWLAELHLACALVLLWFIKEILTFRKEGDKDVKLALLLAFILLLFPFLIFNAEGPALRFVLLFMLLWPLLLAFIAKWLNRPVITLLCGLFAIVSVFSYRAYNPAEFDPPYAMYKSITTGVMKEIDTDNTKLVIMHKGLAEYFTFTTGLDAMPWQTDEDIDSARVMRVSCNIENMEFKRLLEPSEMQQVLRMGLQYYLMPEKVWRAFTAKAIIENEGDLISRIRSVENPWQLRPGFITRGRKRN